MDFRLKSVFLFLVFAMLAGCKPNDEVDIYEFKLSSGLLKAEGLAKNVIKNLDPENIYPYTPKKGCEIKKLGLNQIFVCFENDIVTLGGSLNAGKLEQNRNDFNALAETLKRDFGANGVEFIESYKKSISSEEFKKIQLYHE